MEALDKRTFCFVKRSAKDKGLMLIRGYQAAWGNLIGLPAAKGQGRGQSRYPQRGWPQGLRKLRMNQMKLIHNIKAKT